jgi:hypothetical protein
MAIFQEDPKIAIKRKGKPTNHILTNHKSG